MFVARRVRSFGDWVGLAGSVDGTRASVRVFRRFVCLFGMVDDFRRALSERAETEIGRPVVCDSVCFLLGRCAFGSSVDEVLHHNS